MIENGKGVSDQYPLFSLIIFLYGAGSAETACSSSLINKKPLLFEVLPLYRMPVSYVIY